MILESIQHHAVNHPHRLALTGQLDQFDYDQLIEEINLLATTLAPLQGGILGIALENSPAWAIVDLAAIQLVIPTVPLPLFFSHEQIAHAIRQAGVQVIICDHADQLTQLLATQNIQIATKSSYWIGQTLITILILQGIDKVQLPEQTAKITFTSGTTGQPKGVCLSMQQMQTVSNALLKATDADQYDHHLSILPLGTLLENVAGLYVPLFAGASVTLLRSQSVGLLGAAGLDVKVFLQAILKHRATTLILTPELLTALASVIEAGAAFPEHLRFVAVGGAKVSAQLIQRAKRLGLPIFEGYGLSECASVVSLNTRDANKIGSVGRPLAHITIDFAQDGEILVKGNTFLGYVGFARSSNHDYLATGDIGHLDDDGYLFISGRKKSMFITSYGRNVSPEWVECALVELSVIRQAVVFGEAKAWNAAVIVVDKSITDHSIQSAIEAINQTLPDYARVRKWLRADHPFSLQNSQLTGNGRIRREVIWQQYQEKIEALYQTQFMRESVNDIL